MVKYFYIFNPVQGPALLLFSPSRNSQTGKVKEEMVFVTDILDIVTKVDLITRMLHIRILD